MSVKGLEKSAQLLIFIGSKKRAKVLKFLTTSEIEKIIHLMLKVKKVSFNEIKKICLECKLLLSQFKEKEKDSNEYIFSTLNEAVNKISIDKFSSNINRENVLFYKLKILSAIKDIEIVNLLEKQHPQIITNILVYMERKKSARILSLLDENIQLDVILRIALFSKLTDSSQVEILKIIDLVLKEAQYLEQNSFNRNVNVVDNTSDFNNIKEIINSTNKSNIDLSIDFLVLLDDQKKTKIIKKINDMNIYLSKKIINRIFLFKDISNLLDREIKLLLREINLEDLYVATCKMSENFKKVFTKNMSTNQLYYFNNQIKDSALSFSDKIIENKQKHILNIIKLLVKYNKISISRLEKRYV